MQTFRIIYSICIVLRGIIWYTKAKTESDMEEYIPIYVKQYPPEPASVYQITGFPMEEDTPEDLSAPLTGDVPAGAQYFAKLAIWLSIRWHISVSVTQHADCVAVEYTFPEHCTFLTPYLSEMKEFIQLSDDAHIIPNYDARILQMVFMFEYPAIHI